MLQEVDLKFAYRATPTGLYLISTSLKGKRNVQFAFRALGISDQPPLLAVGIQHKNYSLGVIHETKEFVLNTCSEGQLHAIDQSRGLSGRDVDDKFALLGLEALPAKIVQAPLVAGCHASVECRVRDYMKSDDVTIFLAEALVCHMDKDNPAVGRLAGKNFRLDGPI